MKKTGILLYLLLFFSTCETFSQPRKFCILLADDSKPPGGSSDETSNEIFSIIKESIRNEINFRNDATVLDENAWLHYRTAKKNDSRDFIDYFSGRYNSTFIFKLTLESAEPITSEPEIKKLKLQFLDVSKPEKWFDSVTVFYFYKKDVGKFMRYINRYICDIKDIKKIPDEDNKLYVVPNTTLLQNTSFGTSYSSTLMLFFGNDDLCNIFYILPAMNPHKLSIQSSIKDNKTVEFSYKKGLTIKKTCSLKINLIGNSSDDINKYCKDITENEK